MWLHRSSKAPLLAAVSERFQSNRNSRALLLDAGPTWGGSTLQDLNAAPTTAARPHCVGYAASVRLQREHGGSTPKNTHEIPQPLPPLPLVTAGKRMPELVLLEAEGLRGHTGVHTGAQSCA